MDPVLTPELREHLVDMWVRVTNRGGSVGFVPPVTAELVWATAERSFARVEEGSDTLVCLVAEGSAGRAAAVRGGGGAHGPVEYGPVARGESLGPDDEVVAWLLLAESESVLRRHWRTVYRVQVEPTWQGTGLGTALMAAAADYARTTLGLEALTLMTRSGTGAERFYKRCGYREVGRIPGAIRVGPGDDRDEVHFWLDLVPPPADT